MVEVGYTAANPDPSTIKRDSFCVLGFSDASYSSKWNIRNLHSHVTTGNTQLPSGTYVNELGHPWVFPFPSPALCGGHRAVGSN